MNVVRYSSGRDPHSYSICSQSVLFSPVGCCSCSLLLFVFFSVVFVFSSSLLGIFLTVFPSTFKLAGLDRVVSESPALLSESVCDGAPVSRILRDSSGASVERLFSVVTLVWVGAA